MSRFFKRLKKKGLRMRFRPIRVFCFHQVSDEFEPETMYKCDWTQTDTFKRNVLGLKKRYTFISLPEVTEHLQHDRLRLKRYAALTADDGWASLKNILPWLAEQKIPITLFLNPLYFDGTHYQSKESEKLLTGDEILSLMEQYRPFITVASHGWSHKNCLEMSMDEFGVNVGKAEEALAGMKGKIPYYAFTYGRRKVEQVHFLQSQLLHPVLMDGNMNYVDDFCVHRELLDGEQFDY